MPRLIRMNLNVPTSLTLTVADPQDPDEGFGWEIKSVEVDAIQDICADDVRALCTEDDFAELDKLANAAEEL